MGHRDGSGSAGRGALLVLRWQRRLSFITPPAGDARREEGAMRSLVWFGLACAECTSASSRSCATMRPSGGKALERRGLLGGWGGALRMRHRDDSGVAGRGALLVLRWQRRLWFVTPPAGDARRERGAMRGARRERCAAWFGLACAVRTSASSRSCATIWRSGGSLVERRGLLGGWGGMLRMRHREG
jgi:hypothetical protein